MIHKRVRLEAAATPAQVIGSVMYDFVPMDCCSDGKPVHTTMQSERMQSTTASVIPELEMQFGELSAGHRGSSGPRLQSPLVSGASGSGSLPKSPAGKVRAKAARRLSFSLIPLRNG